MADINEYNDKAWTLEADDNEGYLFIELIHENKKSTSENGQLRMFRRNDNGTLNYRFGRKEKIRKRLRLQRFPRQTRELPTDAKIQIV